MSLPDLPALLRDGDGPVFREPWEAQVFAMIVSLHERGTFTWSEWTQALGKQLKSGIEENYYESCLKTLETLVERNYILSHEERLDRIEAWDRAARATPHGSPIELSRASQSPGKPPAASTPGAGGSR
ncbi:MAG: nitrile hydratase accessory protein [Hyphomicrobiales bacterium]